MDRVVETSNGAAQTSYYQVIKKTVQFLVLVSVFSSVYSYSPGFQFFFSYNLQISTLFACVLDRKYMFLICNGILAFLAKNLKLSSSSSLNHSGGFMTSDDDCVKQITEIPSTLEEYASSPSVMAVEEEDEKTAQQEKGYGDIRDGYKEMKMESVILENEEDEQEEDEEDYNEFKENRGHLDSISSMEEANDASVSTEELNKKFEEFIKKMKEEIRLEAQQRLTLL